jgi:hypothetical protein
VFCNPRDAIALETRISKILKEFFWLWFERDRIE